MQTITLPWTASIEDQATISGWQRAQACVVRSGYAEAHEDTGMPRSEQALRGLLKERFPDHPLGSWAIHCATREGMRLRKLRPEGKVVFGGRGNLERLNKGLINHKSGRKSATPDRSRSSATAQNGATVTCGSRRTDSQPW